MQSFDDFKISKQLQYAITDLGFEKPTPIQSEAFSIIVSGKDVVGIAQTGTGKTFAYMLPILQMLPFAKQIQPRVLVLVPTRELVVQVVEEIEKFGKYSDIKVLGVYGGTNINRQKEALALGADIVVATPGRLYDLVLCRALQLKAIKKLVIDEVDVMLDLGFRFQLTNIFELLPERRQNIMFSATMTEEIETLINDFFIGTHKIAVAVSGTPLENIAQSSYAVPNFYTKANLLVNLLQDATTFNKVLVFVSNKKSADLLFNVLNEHFNDELCVIHSNKTQNYRLRSIKQFDEGKNRILVTTDVMARGLDLDEISHVVNFDTPAFPENYMHRIGRTGRAEKEGTSLLFYTEKETKHKEAIEALMDMKIPEKDVPSEVKISKQLAPEEQPQLTEPNNPHKPSGDYVPGAGFHEKKEKNAKENQGGSYKRIIKKKYKKPKTKGDKNYNKRNKK
ncbi:ATP-dependent RNA helicase RhlE [Ulvibacter sp. MAR_2010_11]|uniref:DEAD/DEAH box helicase n=1 Tax=Ulvibacter sp. MAR_2010_11 TaxID=1250229 RepID=UPI000C2B7B9C|nr:DEAD/DEAH box helicase [Ulvibacter sp. MAR_2010_11]PKA84148.1 ATP-dependent RNA helicase RhlE [Ulvibacter sp. MAR_2010_11]